MALEDSLKLFEEGVNLSAACKQELEAAEGKVQMLVKQRMDHEARELPDGEADLARSPRNFVIVSARRGSETRYNSETAFLCAPICAASARSDSSRRRSGQLHAAVGRGCDGGYAGKAERRCIAQQALRVCCDRPALQARHWSAWQQNNLALGESSSMRAQ